MEKNIRLMYALIAKCEELDAKMEPVNEIARDVAEIKRMLDVMEKSVWTTCCRNEGWAICSEVSIFYTRNMRMYWREFLENIISRFFIFQKKYKLNEYLPRIELERIGFLVESRYVS